MKTSFSTKNTSFHKRGYSNKQRENMEISKVLLILCMSTITLGSCSNKELITFCSLEKPGLEIKYKYVSNWNTLLKTVMNQKYKLETIGRTEEEFNNGVSEFKTRFTELGIGYEVKIENGVVYEDINIDHSKVNTEDLENANLVEKSSNGKRGKHIGLKQTIDGIEKMGVICEK